MYFINGSINFWFLRFINIQDNELNPLHVPKAVIFLVSLRSHGFKPTGCVLIHCSILFDAQIIQFWLLGVLQIGSQLYWHNLSRLWWLPWFKVYFMKWVNQSYSAGPLVMGSWIVSSLFLLEMVQHWTALAGVFSLFWP